MKRFLVALSAIFLLTAQSGAADDPEARKDRTIAQLKAEGVPVFEGLPFVSSEAEALRRSEREIVERMLGAMITAVKAETNDDTLIENVIAQYNAAAFFTPEERAFLASPDPDQAARAKFGWRYEGVLVLMWALNLVDTLPRPEEIVDVSMMGSIMSELGTEGLMTRARLQPQAEILDALDLAYRYHWAVVDARINDRPTPTGLDGGVVFERHRALNWVTGYQGQSWDDISTDT